MMDNKRIRLYVAYDGTNYHGWQIQNNGITIEGELNKALTDLFGSDTAVIGASRTDSGVHALGNVAVFDTDSKIPAEKMFGAINARLPEDIRVIKSEEVSADWHPRHCDCRKTYEYKIVSGRVEHPTDRLYSHFTYNALDVCEMRRAAAYFIGEHDFTSLCAAGSQAETTVRTIYNVEVICDRNDKQSAVGGRYGENTEVIIRVTGNGFLYNMVRILAGTILDVGMGRKKAGEIPAILDACDRRLAGPTLPAKGLTLIGYDYD